MTRITKSEYVEFESDTEDFDDEDLIKELEERGYSVFGNGIVRPADLPWLLYQSFILDDDKEFRNSVRKILIENGFKP
jgi:hypothetical protein